MAGPKAFLCSPEYSRAKPWSWALSPDPNLSLPPFDLLAKPWSSYPGPLRSCMPSPSVSIPGTQCFPKKLLSLEIPQWKFSFNLKTTGLDLGLRNLIFDQISLISDQQPISPLLEIFSLLPWMKSLDTSTEFQSEFSRNLVLFLTMKFLILELLKRKRNFQFSREFEILKSWGRFLIALKLKMVPSHPLKFPLLHPTDFEIPVSCLWNPHFNRIWWFFNAAMLLLWKTNAAGSIYMQLWGLLVFCLVDCIQSFRCGLNVFSRGPLKLLSSSRV